MPQRYLDHLLSPELVSYRPRAEMEEDPSFKQLIPYVLFRYRDAEGQSWMFRYTRGSGQGESRLHRKQSVGVGGHISLEDAEAPHDSNPYREGMRRELDEEVVIETLYSDRCVGLINDDCCDLFVINDDRHFAVHQIMIRPGLIQQVIQLVLEFKVVFQSSAVNRNGYEIVRNPVYDKTCFRVRVNHLKLGCDCKSRASHQVGREQASLSE